MAKYYATRPFAWAGKNIKVGDEVVLDEAGAKWMIFRGAVTEDAPVKPAPKKKEKVKK